VQNITSGLGRKAVKAAEQSVPPHCFPSSAYNSAMRTLQHDHLSGKSSNSQFNFFSISLIQGIRKCNQYQQSLQGNAIFNPLSNSDPQKRCAHRDRCSVSPELISEALYVLFCSAALSHETSAEGPLVRSHH